MADIYVNSGVTSSNITLNNAQNMFVFSGGTANNTTVNEDSFLFVSKGGTVNDTVINNWGEVDLSSSGTANGTIINKGGYLEAFGKAIGTVVGNGGTFVVSSGGTASDTTVKEGGYLTLMEGSLKGSTTVEQGGTATIVDAVEKGISVHGGTLIVKTGEEPPCFLDDVTVDSGGSLAVSSGAYVASASVENASVTVFKGGNFASAELTAATVEVKADAIVSSAALNRGTVMNVISGGRLQNIKVWTGGVLTGVLREASELKFYGGTLDLNISGISANSNFLVDEQSFNAIMPTAEDYLCTLTVSGTQAEGSYKLIEGGSSFNRTITVKNTSGTELGTLTVGGGATNIDGVNYTLALTGYDLIVMVGDDLVPPEVVNVMADETAMTNQEVTVTAEFTDNIEVASKQYRIGDGAWTDYPSGGVSVSENTTVYFKATDTADNESEIVSYEVANIDKVAPTISNITPNTTEPTDSVTVTANFRDDVALASMLYMIGLSGEWTDYPDEGIVVTRNATVYFKAVDTAGNETEAEYKVNNIDTLPPEPDDNMPDDGWNDYLYKKGMPNNGWNTDENIAEFASNTITDNQEVFLDARGTIESEGKHNLFGNDGTNKDTGDVAKISVAQAAKLTFEINSSAAGTFYVYQDGIDKNGNRKISTVGKVTVKKNKTAKLKDVLLISDPDKYYVAMTAKNVDKVGPDYYGLYNVNVVDSKFFVDADEGEYKNNTWKTAKAVSVKSGSKQIVLDGSPMKGSSTYKNFVGFTDSNDYARLDLASSAYLSFRVTSTGASRFIIWKQKKGTDGKLSKVSLTSLLSKSKNKKTTAAKFLDTSKYTYYVSMVSTNAAKGASVYYNVEISSKSVFFFGDDGRNNVVYDKKAKAFYGEDADHHFETTTIGAETKVKFDADPVVDSDWENFVGYGDSADYAKIKLTSAGNLSFSLKATGNAKFIIYKMGVGSKGKEKLEAIQTTKLTLAKGESIVEKTTDMLAGLEAGEYYVLMKAESTKANDTGSVFYNVTATLDASVSSALEMPMAAAAYADSVQDKLFGESGNGLLASL